MRATMLLLAAASASAQPADSVAAPRRIDWVAFSPEISYRLTPNGEAGYDHIGGSLRYSQMVGATIVSVGASASAEFLFGQGELVEAHVAVGRSASAGPVFAVATIGPSLGRVYSRDAERRVIAPGLYADVQTQLVILPFAGFGVEAFAHLNAVDPLVGVGFVFAFGQLPGALITKTPPTPRRAGP